MNARVILTGMIGAALAVGGLAAAPPPGARRASGPEPQAPRGMQWRRAPQAARRAMAQRQGRALPRGHAQRHAGRWAAPQQPHRWGPAVRHPAAARRQSRDRGRIPDFAARWRAQAQRRGLGAARFGRLQRGPGGRLWQQVRWRALQRARRRSGLAGQPSPRQRQHRPHGAGRPQSGPAQRQGRGAPQQRAPWMLW